MAVDPAGNLGTVGADGQIVGVANPNETIQQHFFRCVEQGIEPVCPATDGRKTVATVKAIRESARRGTSVDLAEIG